MGIIDNIKKAFVKEQSVEDKVDEKILAEKIKIGKDKRKKYSREEKISDCHVVLDDCYNFFRNTIIIENSRNREIRKKGLFDNSHRDRVREAAIGMLVIEQAKLELDNIRTDGDLNRAINQMGMALKQIQRLDNTSEAVSTSTTKVLKKWYPYPLEENAADKSYYSQLVVPDDIRDRIDDEFIDGLLNGDSFDICLVRTKDKGKSNAVTGTRQVNRAGTDNNYSLFSELPEGEGVDMQSIEEDLGKEYGNMI